MHKIRRWIALVILAIFISIVGIRDDMEFRFVYKCLPVVMCHMDVEIPTGAAAAARGLFIFVKPPPYQMPDPDAIITHELTHCKQWYKSGCVMQLFYLIDNDYKIAIEAEAYQAQLECYKEWMRPHVMDFIIEGFNEFYKTNASREQLILLMKGEY